MEDDDDDDLEGAEGAANGKANTAALSTALAVVAFPRHLLVSKWGVAAILVTSSCLLGYYTYSYTNDEQTKNFLEEVS